LPAIDLAYVDLAGRPQLLAPDSGHYEAASERGANRTAVMATLIVTAKLNDVDPQAWLADVLARIDDHTIQNVDQLPPWNWKLSAAKLAA
jgi:hypothetical protein